MDLKQFEYYADLQALVNRGANINDFLILYRKHFTEDPSEKMMEDYLDKINGVVPEDEDSDDDESYEEEESYEESYDDN